jgi:hypothetical protein
MAPGAGGGRRGASRDAMRAGGGGSGDRGVATSACADGGDGDGSPRCERRRRRAASARAVAVVVTGAALALAATHHMLATALEVAALGRHVTGHTHVGRGAQPTTRMNEQRQHTFSRTREKQQQSYRRRISGTRRRRMHFCARHAAGSQLSSMTVTRLHSLAGVNVHSTSKEVPSASDLRGRPSAMSSLRDVLLT